MSLSERDKADLLGLVSGLGTVHSRGRARRLSKVNSEAAEYLRQMSIIANAFRVPSTIPADRHLSAEQVDALTEVVAARAGRIVAPPRSTLGTVLLRLPAVGAAAAVIVMAFCGVWVSWTTKSVDRKAPFGSLVWLPEGYAGAAPYEQEELIPGQLLSTERRDRARMTLSNGTIMFLDRDGSVRIGRDGCSYELYEGSLLIDTRKWATVRVKGTTLGMRGGRFQVQILPSGVSWTVLAGRATLSVPNESRELVAGQEARWNEAAGSLEIGPLRTPASNQLDQDLWPR